MASVLLPAGCSRQFWRTQTDKDVYHLLAHKKDDPRWNVPRVHIMPDPSSRLFDPYDLDNGPLPLDDPAAGRYMLRVAGMSGYKSWHKFGVRFSIENPHWLERYGLTPEVIQQASLNNEPSTAAGEVEIKNISLADAVELSNIHSRDYQTQIENAYLAALALTFERFQFGVRYLGLAGGEPSIAATHSSTPHGPNNISLDSRFGVSQLLPSGGQWAVEIANNTLWMFAGPNQVATTSLLSYSLVQPLLFQAGRKIALENLTQAERDTLYAVRNLARFRQTFFVDVVGGGGGFLAVLRQAQLVDNERGNVRRTREQLEQLLALNSQVTLIYYEDLDALPAGIDEFPPILAGQLEYRPAEKRLYWRGQMSPLQIQTLLNLSADPAWQAAVKSLIQRRIHEPLDALPAGIKIPPSLNAQLTYSAAQKRLYWKGPMSEVQERLLLSLSSDPAWLRAVTGLVNRMRVEIRDQNTLQLQSSLLSSQNALRSAERNYQNLLDGFKIRLGLPPNIKLSTDLSLLKQFQLIDPRVSAMEESLKDYVLEWAKLDLENPDEASLRDVISGLRQLRDRVQTDVLDVLQADVAAVRKVLPQRLKAKATAEQRNQLQSDFDRDEELRKALIRDYQDATGDLQRLERNFGAADRATTRRAALIAALGAVQGSIAYQQQKRAVVRGIATLREELLQITRNAQGIEVSMRVELIELAPFSMTIDEVMRRALAERLDLKNARALVMDARRRVEVAANRLQAVLNLRVEGDVGTRTGNKPLDFRGRQSNFRVGLAFTAPLDLINERNAYRQAQIAYQRARRAYMALEDSIKFAVRVDWREIELTRQNFETARQQVRFAAIQFDNSVEEASNPDPQARANPGLALLNALERVLDSQNSLIANWVNYETSRLNIYADMGMMEIDSRGLWADPFYQGGTGAATPGPPPAPSAALPSIPAQGRPDDLRPSHPDVGVPPPRLLPGNRNLGGIERRGRSASTAQAGKVRVVAGAPAGADAAGAGGSRRGGRVPVSDDP